MHEISRPTFVLLIDDIAAQLGLERSEVLDRIRHSCDRKRRFYTDITAREVTREVFAAAREKRLEAIAAEHELTASAATK
jgi:hypothetical protein